MAQYDDLNTRQIWSVGIISAALTVVTVLAVQVLYYALLARHNDVKLGQSEYTQSRQYLAEQASEIGRYGRDPETGAVQIPIERAIRLVIERSAAAVNVGEAQNDPEPEPEAGTDDDQA